MNCLGIDYGDKHTGLALASTFVAEPLEVVPTPKALDRIGELIALHQIETLVIGLSEQAMAEKSRLFARQLTDRYRLPVHFQDETLSSQDTRRQLARQGIKRSIRQAKTDHYVAAAILQEYLNTHDQGHLL